MTFSISRRSRPARCRWISSVATSCRFWPTWRASFRPRAEHRGVSFSVEYEGEIPETILTDAARLRQAIINLAGNAGQIHGTGGACESSYRCWRNGKTKPAVQIEVIDTGVGIREEVLPLLFQPFSQGDASVAQKFGGTGLGLAISRRIADMLGGDLSVSSRWGEGSTFHANCAYRQPARCPPCSILRPRSFRILLLRQPTDQPLSDWRVCESCWPKTASTTGH